MPKATFATIFVGDKNMITEPVSSLTPSGDAAVLFTIMAGADSAGGGGVHRSPLIHLRKAADPEVGSLMTVVAVVTAKPIEDLPGAALGIDIGGDRTGARLRAVSQR